ncbi:MAG: putative sugar nucleotidyl transferase [Phycisphaerae bacterium]
MAPIYLFEDSHFDHLYPLTLSRPACLLPCGTMTLLARLQNILGPALTGLFVRPGLAEAIKRQVTLPVNPSISAREGVILLNARWLMLPAEFPTAAGGAGAGGKGVADPLEAYFAAGRTSEQGGGGVAGLVANAIAWIYLTPEQAEQVDFSQLHLPKTLEALLPMVERRAVKATLIQRPWDLLNQQAAAFLADWPRYGTAQLGKVAEGVVQLGREQIHLGQNVRLSPLAVLDATHGPIVLEGSSDPAAATEVQAHAVITGPCYIGPGCVIRAHADIRGDCHLGPQTRVGGEVVGSIFLGFSSKQHYGFVGQSIVGQWANLGAGTTTSNLKNTYGTVRMPLNGREESTGRQFVGSVIADHAKLGIGTYLSTGSVVGFASHVTVSRAPKFVPSFAWVTSEGPGTGGAARPAAYHIARIDFDKAVALAQTVMSRRNVTFTPADHELFVRIAGEYAAREAYDWDENIPRSTPPESP